jgi:hypothetical protein
MLRRNIAPPSSGSDKPSNKPVVAGDGLTLRLLFDPEDGDDIFLRNKRWTLSELLGVITQKDCVSNTEMFLSLNKIFRK